MTIEITNPEVEVMVQQRMRAGAFENAETLLRARLRPAAGSEARTGADLIAAMRLCPHPEVDIDPERVPSPLVRDVSL